MTRVLICGDREWKDRAYIYDRLDEMVPLYGISEVIEGCARGADRIGEAWAADRGLPTDHTPAEWDRYKPSDPARKNPAGAIRNRAMLAKGPDMVVAFHTSLQQSHGTRDMVELARAAGVQTFVFPHSHEGYRK